MFYGGQPSGRSPPKNSARMARSFESTTSLNSSHHLSPCSRRSVQRPAGLKSEPLLSTCVMRIPFIWRRMPAPADLIAGGRLELGISRGSGEQVIDGWRYFGYAPGEGETHADLARRH